MSLKIALKNVYEEKLQRGSLDFIEQLVNFMLKNLNNELTVFLPYKKYECEIFKENRRKSLQPELREHASYKSKAFLNILGKGSLLQPLNSS